MRLPLVFASLLFVSPAMAEHVELSFETSGFVKGLRYFGSEGWQSSETIINFNQTDGDVVKCGSVINTEFRIGATVDQAHVDEFIGRYNDLLYAYLHGAPISLTVVCKDNLPEVIETSVDKSGDLRLYRRLVRRRRSYIPESHRLLARSMRPNVLKPRALRRQR